MVSVLRQVDVVISVLAVPQHLLQLQIIVAIEEASNIKRFIASEFGNDVDTVSALPPFQLVLDKKKKIRRATEAAGIPYTCVCANSFAAYFVDYLLHPRENHDHVTIYGTALPHPDNIRLAILHNIFIEGDQMSFELTEEDLEASKLYPDYNYTSVDELLDICLVNRPKPKFTSF